MKHLFLFAAIIFTIGMHGQENKAEDKAKLMIKTFFDGFHSGDVEKMKSVMSKQIVMQRTFTDQNGTPQVTTTSGQNIIDAVRNRPSNQKWDERLLDFKVHIDGNLANVWTPYEFWVNDTFSHCGANSFTLARTENGWKIVHLIDSRRKNSCR